MTTPLLAKFINQIDYLARQLLTQLAENPYALQTESNVLLHQFEGLALHTNHFGEKNGIKIQFSKEFRDLANSVKHIRNDPKNQVGLTSSTMFELGEDGFFRFIRNTIEARYPDGRVFDGAEELCAAIRLYFPVLGYNGPDLPIIEASGNRFYDRVILYHRDDLSVHTQNTGITIVKRKGDKWLTVDPKEVSLVVLDKSQIGQTPTRYPIQGKVIEIMAR